MDTQLFLVCRMLYHHDGVTQKKLHKYHVLNIQILLQPYDILKPILFTQVIEGKKNCHIHSMVYKNIEFLSEILHLERPLKFSSPFFKIPGFNHKTVVEGC